MQLKPGDRVRCVDIGGSKFLDEGRTYTVTYAEYKDWITIFGVRAIDIGCYRRSRFKPVIRVKAPTRSHDERMPYDAVPGDLIVGNRGAAAKVREWHGSDGYRSLIREYAGNYYEGVRPAAGCRVHDFSGGTRP